MTSPHLLYIAFWYPPSRASGVYRAIATTKAFVRAGWDVTVVTVTQDFLEDEVGSTDPGLMAGIPEQAHVVRIPFSAWGAQVDDLRSMSWLTGNFPRLARRPKGQFPDKYARWIDPVIEFSSALHVGSPIRHILATGNPYSSFEAARVLSSQIEVPFSVDFRDPWSFDVFTGSRIHDGDVLRAEARIVGEAEFCFHVNQALADAYAKAYPERAERQVSVRNGYDLESLGRPHTPSGIGPLRFGALGTITELWPLTEMFEGWSSVRSDLPPGSELVLAGHLGYFQQSEPILRSRFPPDGDGVRYVGPISKARVPDFYGGLDVVVAPVFGGPMMTSGKIYEAVGLGIPLLCIQREGGGAREVISAHPLARGAEPDATSVGKALLETARLCEDLTLARVEEVRSAMSGHERGRAIQPMVDSIAGLNHGA